MDRRAFFIKSLLGLGAAGALASIGELDLDRLLWVPGQKTIFLPPVIEPKLFEVSMDWSSSYLTSGLSEWNDQFARAIAKRWADVIDQHAMMLLEGRRDLAYIRGDAWPVMSRAEPLLWELAYGKPAGRLA